MNLRPYQIEGVEQTFDAWKRAKSVLGVAATGLGKTIMLASIIARNPGRAMVVAHREELIFQAADKIKRVTGLEPDIEMAELRSTESLLVGKAPVVISTIQTQTAGSNGGRMSRFTPDEFGLLVIDEAHHATASTYRQVIDYYREGNPDLRILGVTATPDRADEEALGQIFDDVAFEYDIRYGIAEGWLVPIIQRAVHVEHLDLSSVRTTAGDLNGGDLARVLEYETTMLEIVAPTIELTQDRKTLIFTASVPQADRMCEIINRYKPNSAQWVCGRTPKDDRRKMFAAYARRDFQYLVNVDVATEGFDDPTIQVVVLAKPTKSRAKYTQMNGRGTRPLPGIVDHPDLFGSAAGRCRAIASSDKPSVEIIDFVGNSGRHRLITTADVLGGNYSDEIVDRARKNVERDGQANMLEALEQAEKEIREEHERVRREEAARRANLIARASYKTTIVDPFDVFGIEPWREKGWNKGKPISDKMVALLERQGVDTRNLSYTQARQLITEITSRWDNDQCSYKQARILRSRGLDTNVTLEQAKQMIDAIAIKENWRSRGKIPAAKPKSSAEVVRY